MMATTDKEKHREYARNYYHRTKNDPEKSAKRKARRDSWWQKNKEDQRAKQRENKRQRKIEAIAYKGGKCSTCGGEFHPAAFEFHHINPKEKDRDPSKMMGMSKEKLFAELDKCVLLCANCHRLEHHKLDEEM